MSITLHIERLILDGILLPAGGERRLRAVVEAELGRLLASEMRDSRFEIGTLHDQAPGSNLCPVSSLGRAIAHTIYYQLELSRLHAQR